MNFSIICIQRPVLACVIHLILVVIGIVCFERMHLQYFPDIPHPVVTVSASYPGAGSSLMETQVTNVLESGLSGVAGMASMSSSSSPGSSKIEIHFRLGGDFDREINDVRDKVASVRSRLPDSVTSATVTVGGTERPVLNIGFFSDSGNQSQLRNYVVRRIQPELAQVRGVGAVWVMGSSNYALRIWLSAERMAALGITVSDVQDILKGNNVDFPAGQIVGVERTFGIVSDVQLTTPEEFGNLIVKEVEDKPIFLKDVATVEWGNDTLDPSSVFINGKPGIDVEVRPRYNENPIDVAKWVTEELTRIKANLPKGVSVVVTYDQSQFLKSAIEETELAVLFAIILVVIVVYLFLGSIRSAFIPIITIPLCLIDVFWIMNLFGFSLNIMTLLAMVLAIGLVVDDAIVVLENIHRHIELGLDRLQAAIIGAREITFPVIAMTLTLAAVYAPIGFSEGLSALVFEEFAFTLAGAVIISGFIALTLSPMLCSRMIESKPTETRLQHRAEYFFQRLSDGYRFVLRIILQRKLWIATIWLIIAILGLFLYRSMPAEFVPEEDIGYFTTTIIPPTSSNIHYIKRQMLLLDNIYQSEPAIDYYATFILTNGPTNFVTLKKWGVRRQTLSQVLHSLAPKLAAIPGITAYTVVPRPIDMGDVDDNDMTLQVTTTQSYEALNKTLQKITKELKKYPGLINVRDTMKFDNQQYKITLKRDAIGAYDVNPQDVATTLTTMLGGSHVTDVMLGNRSYSVLVQMQKSDLTNFQGLDKLFVKTRSGLNVPLANLVTISPKIGQASLSHYNRYRSGSITAQFAPGYTESMIVKYLNALLPHQLSSSESYAYSGRIQEYLASKGDMTSLFILSIIFIYLILAAQFESFLDPLVILFSVPLSIVGSLLVLRLTGGTLNLYTNIGMITLVGLIAKHGILITQFANLERAKGHSLEESIITAAVIRLRPILMTTVAMVVGSLPLAFATGPGTHSHQQIGRVLVGGLLIGTFFSLVIVPIVYYYFSLLRMRTHARSSV